MGVWRAELPGATLEQLQSTRANQRPTVRLSFKRCWSSLCGTSPLRSFAKRGTPYRAQHRRLQKQTPVHSSEEGTVQQGATAQNRGARGPVARLWARPWSPDTQGAGWGCASGLWVRHHTLRVQSRMERVAQAQLPSQGRELTLRRAKGIPTTPAVTEKPPGGWRLSRETPQKWLLGAGQLRGSGGSGGAPGRQVGGGTSYGGRTQLPRRGASPQGHAGLSVLQSPRAPPALPAGHPVPWSCLLGGCLHGRHPFVRWFSNLITSENHWRLAPLLLSEVLSPWVWCGPDTQHFPGSCFSGDPLGDALPWTTASRGRSSVLPGEGG